MEATLGFAIEEALFELAAKGWNETKVTVRELMRSFLQSNDYKFAVELNAKPGQQMLASFLEYAIAIRLQSSY